MILRNFFFTIILFNSAFAQSVNKSQSVPFPGTGPYTSQPDAFSFSTNPAALSNYKENLLGVFSERKFLMEENSIHALYLGLPTKKGNFGFLLNYSGFSNFNQYEIAGAYSKKLGDLSAGIQFGYSSLKITDYKNTNLLSATIGVVFKVNPKFYTGFQVANFIQSKYKNQKLPSTFRIGCGYQPSVSVFLGMDITKEENVPGSVLILLKYNYNQKFFSGLSFNAANITTSGSAGIAWNNYRVDISAGYHQYLGVSPGITFYTKL